MNALPTTPTSTSTPTVALPINPHYLRLGGPDAVQRLVDAFYRAMDTREDARVIRAMHEADLGPTRALLARYLGEWMGGPKDYSRERGAPKLRHRHLPFAIDDAARDAWMACMRQALTEACPDAGLRAELDAAFSKVANVLRNTESPESPDPHPDPATSPTPRSPS